MPIGIAAIEGLAPVRITTIPLDLELSDEFTP